MIRWRIVLTICRKELLETIRDRRTMILMMLPVVLYPVLMIGLGQIMSHQQAKLNEEKAEVMIVGTVPPELVKRINEESRLRYVQPTDPPEIPQTFSIVTVAPEKGKKKNPIIRSNQPKDKVEYDEQLKAWARTRLKAGEADMILMVPGDFSDEIVAGRTGTGLIFYDETNEQVHAAYNHLFDLLVQYRRDLLRERLAGRPELPAGFDRPLFIEPQTVASAKERGGYFAGRILPMMIIFMVMLGAFYPAVDLAAGEKERGTMQTLLTAPASPMDILMGKFFTVFIVSMFSALVNLGSLAFALVYLLVSGNVAENLNFQLEWTTGLILLPQLIPVAVLFSALMLAISVFAKSFKEAQNYLTPLYLLVIVPTVLTGLPGMNLTHRTAWLPIVNITLLIKDMLVEPPSAAIIIMVLIANCAYSLLALLVAARIFRNERVLLGGQGAFADTFRTEGINTNSRATPGLAFTAFGIGLVLYLLFFSVFSKWNPSIGLILTQVVILVVPVLLLIRRLKLSYTETLSLRLPTLRRWVGVLIAGCTSAIVMGNVGGWLQNQIIPMPKMIREIMQDEMSRLGMDSLPLLLAFLMIAVTPAICEEVFFRGLILSGLRNGFSKWPAIFITAVCFGVFHMNIYQMLPAILTGFVITLIVWETHSIYAGMAYHLLHNGVLVLVMRLKWFPDLFAEEGQEFSMLKFAVCVVVFLMGITLALWPTPSDAASRPEKGLATPPGGSI